MVAATANLAAGYLLQFDLTGNQRKAANNLAKDEPTESESVLIERDFGVVTDIRMAPMGICT